MKTTQFCDCVGEQHASCFHFFIFKKIQAVKFHFRLFYCLPEYRNISSNHNCSFSFPREKYAPIKIIFSSLFPHDQILISSLPYVHSQRHIITHFKQKISSISSLILSYFHSFSHNHYNRKISTFPIKQSFRSTKNINTFTTTNQTNQKITIFYIKVNFSDQKI